jgi:hypothetical protein
MEAPHHEEKERKIPNRAMALNERHKKQPESVFQKVEHSIQS